MPTRSIRDDLMFLRERMNRVFEESLQDSALVAGPGRIVPCVDIYEDEASVYIKIELPGVSRQDISLDISDRVLTVSGTKPSPHTEAAGSFHLVERQYGCFMRSFSLPSDIDVEKVSANFQSGVLEIVLPRVGSRRSRKIKIANE